MPRVVKINLEDLEDLIRDSLYLSNLYQAGIDERLENKEITPVTNSDIEEYLNLLIIE